MSGLFLNILDMSLSASWIVLAVLAARLVLKRAPKWLLCGAWALVALRLLLPFSVESSLSLIPRQDPFEEAAGALMNDYVGSTHTYFDMTPEYQLARDAGMPTFPAEEEAHFYVVTGETPVTPPTTLGDILPEVGAAVWIAGMAAMICYAALSYRRIRKRVEVSIALGNGVYLCDYIDTPFILGILKPKIYLPSEMDPRDAAHVLSHEQAHLKRRDHWWKPLGYLLLTVHWFNPLLWIAYILLCRDIELACDERVIRELKAPEKKAYTEALLKCSVSRRMIAACPLAFGEVGVKQRIKSVLNYKKPGFWVLALGLLVIAVVAICFLTDPMGHNLGNIVDIRTDDVLRIDVCGRKGTLRLETEEEITELLDFLDTIEYDPTPVSDTPIAGDTDENDWDLQVIRIFYEESQQLILMDYDRTLVWSRDEDGTNSLPCSLTDRDAFVTFLQQHVTPVMNQAVSAEPFATMTQPGQWLQGITPEVVKKARVFSIHEPTMDTSYLTVSQVSQVTALLNQIPASALKNGQTDMEFHYSDLRYFSQRSVMINGISLILEDGANGLTGILRLYDENQLELVLLEGFGIDSSTDDSSYEARIWDVNSEDLAAQLRELSQDPPNIMVFAGSRYDFRREKEVITDGEVTISTIAVLSWEYEVISPEDGEPFFGFRCRPKDVEEGWLYFGWWGDDFVPGEEIRLEYGNWYGPHYTQYSSAEDADGDSNYDRYHCIHGDFVITRQGTDHWPEEYREDISDIEAFTSVACASHLELTEIPAGIEGLLGDAAYYDWDSIAREIGVEKMTLFDPQVSGGYLFVGCKHEDGYHIARFRREGLETYRYMDVTKPETQFTASPQKQAVLMSAFQEDGSKLYHAILDDPSVKGLEYTGGVGGYLPLTQTPALVLLDGAQWPDGVPEFQLRNEEAPSLRVCLEQSRRYLTFERTVGNTRDKYYVYHNNVCYFDGEHQPGQYSLTEEEVRDMIQILSDIPPANIRYAFMPEIGDLQVSIDLWMNTGVQPDQNHITTSFHYRDEAVYLIIQYSRDISPVYFKIEDAALNAFMLSKYDESRKIANYDTYHAEPIEYSHGDVSLKLRRFLGWEYEVVEYTDGNTPFGIRCRPLEAEEGWLFFGYWPKGFEQEERYIHSEGGVNPNVQDESAYISYLCASEPDSSVWEYYLFPQHPGYVFLNEGADPWLETCDRPILLMLEADSFGNAKEE